MKHELMYFQQSFEGGVVTYGVKRTEDDGYVSGRDYTTDHDTLQALAEKRGATTWDESDILAHHLADKGQDGVTLAESPAQVQAKVDAERKAAEVAELSEPSPVVEIGVAETDQPQ